MGLWSKHEFGQDILPTECFIFAGAIDKISKNAILNKFKEIKYHKHDVYERYIVNDGLRDYVLLFQICGAANIADILKVLEDGKVNKCYFIGYAYGFADDIRVGDFFIPNAVISCDGVVQTIDGINRTSPNEGVYKELCEKFQNAVVPFITGLSVSVPCTLWPVDRSRYPKEVLALEMEYASFCHFSKKLSIVAGGAFIISDTKNQDFLEDKPIRKLNFIRGFEIIFNK